MKKPVIFSLVLIFMVGSCFAQYAKGDLTMGVMTGTPYWGSKNCSECHKDKEDYKDHDFNRFYSKLRLEAGHEGFSANTTILRNTSFEDEEMSETKVLTGYLQYKHKRNYVRGGRVPVANRWVRGAVDGGALKVTYKKFTFAGFGGYKASLRDPEYMFDEDTGYELGYGEVMYRHKGYGGKAKYLYTEDRSLIGGEAFGRFSCTRLTGSIGYDLEDDKISDIGFASYGTPTDEISVYTSYRLFRYTGWNGITSDEYTDRISVGVNYLVSKNYTIAAKEIMTIRNEVDRNHYLTYVSLSHKYFSVGAHYMTSQKENQRLGVTVTGTYTPVNNLDLSAGFTPVSYIFDEEEDYSDIEEDSFSSYFKAKYRMNEYLTFAGHVNYYGDTDMVNKDVRGGLTVQYKFGVGL